MFFKFKFAAIGIVLVALLTSISVGSTFAQNSLSQKIGALKRQISEQRSEVAQLKSKFESSHRAWREQTIRQGAKAKEIVPFRDRREEIRGHISRIDDYYYRLGLPDEIAEEFKKYRKFIELGTSNNTVLTR